MWQNYVLTPDDVQILYKKNVYEIPSSCVESAETNSYTTPHIIDPNTYLVQDFKYRSGDYYLISKTDGIVALALTSHPDFDDTPLWDENANTILDDDGIIWHPHWVVLHSDERVPGGLSIKQYDPEDSSVKLPPTNPGMPMYMDSPGYAVITKGNTIKVVVPKFRIANKTDFSFDGVAAYMQVNTSDKSKPLLGVYTVYSVASGDLSLPFKTTTK